jgi:catechol 2,3-dioxygenase-like lactoylglutathione lyase family enzyme
MQRISISVALAVLALTSVMILGQAPQPAPNTAPAGDIVIGSGSFSPIVSDYERSLRFYSDLVGSPLPATLPAWNTDPALLNFLGVPTAQARFSSVRIPGSTLTVEIVEFKDIDRKPVQPRIQDPGAVRLILIVRDLNALLARLKTQGVPVVSIGGAPVTLTGSERAQAVMIKDPDGFFVELIQPYTLPETNAPAASNVIGARFGLTINDTDQTLKVYRGLLGFPLQVDAAFANDKPLTDLVNTPGAQVRRSTAKIPGSAVQVEFLEFKGIDRKPIGARIQDPGATRLQLRVRDSDATVKALVAAGGSVVTTGGNGGTMLMSGLRVAIVREPNNLFLVIMTQVPRPAPAVPTQ